VPVLRESAPRGYAPLGEDLPTVDPTIGFVLAAADEEVRLTRRRGEVEPAQVEQLPQLRDVRLRLGGCFIGHGFSPSDDSACGAYESRSYRVPHLREEGGMMGFMHSGTTDPLLDEFTRVLLELRWGDMDPYGHVNNVTQLRLLEEARVRALGSPTHSTDAAN